MTPLECSQCGEPTHDLSPITGLPLCADCHGFAQYVADGGATTGRLDGLFAIPRRIIRRLRKDS